MSATFCTRLCGVITLLLLAGALAAQTARPLISVQGTLKDINGVTVADGERNFTFRLYTQATGGQHLWEETARVNVEGGIYSYNLGSEADLSPNDFAQTVYLGITVDGNELQPRTTLTYAPYALSVDYAQSALKIAKEGCSGAVGDVKFSILNPAQFALENGDCWIPLDGRGMGGSALAAIMDRTTLPDGSGAFLRGHEYGANIDDDRTPGSSVATFQGESFRAHSHTMGAAGRHNHDSYDGYVSSIELRDEVGDYRATGNGTFTDGMSGAGTDSYWLRYEDDDDDGIKFYKTDNTRQTSEVLDHTHTLSDEGGNETRPDNINFYIYIRIN